MKNIDDMRVGDFFYLIDSMQEECYEHKRCDKCRYHDICGSDIGSIETISLRQTVESYAEMNGLLNHMNYVDDQKWISVRERLPEDGQKVLTCKNRIIAIQEYEKRRNGWIKGNWFWSMATVSHWMPLPEPWKG